MFLEIFILFYNTIIYIFFFIFFSIDYIFYYYKCRYSGYRGGNFFSNLVFYKIKFLLMIISLLYSNNEYLVYEWSCLDYFFYNDYFFFILFDWFIFFSLFFPLLFILVELEYFLYYEILFIFISIIFSCDLLFKLYDFFLLYILLEILSLCFYILASPTYTSVKAAEAGIKYYIISILSTLSFLYGILNLYSVYGTLNFFKLNIFFSLTLDSLSDFDFYKLIFSISLIILSFFSKIGLAPFHLWLPEIYSGINIVSFVFFSTLTKYVYCVFSLRLVIYIIFHFLSYFSELFFSIAFMSIFTGSIGASGSDQMRRILAYSSISHMGFLFLSLVNFSFIAISSYLVYLFGYVFLNFAFIYLYIYIKQNIYIFEIISDFVSVKGISMSIPLYFLRISLSLGGIPPFVGFYMKLYILYTLNFDLNLIFSTISILSLNLISIYVYMRIVAYMYLSKVRYSIDGYSPVDLSGSIYSEKIEFFHLSLDDFIHVFFFVNIYLFDWIREFNMFVISFLYIPLSQ